MKILNNALALSTLRETNNAHKGVTDSIKNSVPGSASTHPCRLRRH